MSPDQFKRLQAEADVAALVLDTAARAYGIAKRSCAPLSVTTPLLAALGKAAIAYVPVDAAGKPLERSKNGTQR